jgi:hypothetical protein
MVPFVATSTAQWPMYFSGHQPDNDFRRERSDYRDCRDFRPEGYKPKNAANVYPY